MKVRLDLHIHSSRSPDGRMSLEEITGIARERGLDAVAVCDHDLPYTGPAQCNGVLIIPGVEISTSQGHLLGLFVEGVQGSRDLTASAADIRRNGGLAVLAHPFQHRWEAEPLLPLVPSLDGMEVWNSRADRKNPRANQMAMDFAQAHGLPPFAGSDAHLPQEIGNGRILLEVEECSLPALRGALLEGRGQVSGRESLAIYTARSQYTKLKKSSASPVHYGKWAAFAAKCVAEDWIKRKERTACQSL